MPRRIIFFALSIGLTVAVAWEAIGVQALPRVEYRISAEMGEEVVVSVGSRVRRADAERAFRLSPPVAGRTDWDEARRELHFFPDDGFVPGQSYTLIWPGPGSLLARAVPDLGVSFRVEPRRLAGRIEPEVLPHQAVLPQADPSAFVKQNGERVTLDPPRVTRGKSVEINLSTFALQLFEDGRRVGTYEIAGKGNPRAAPTPTGRYKILRKRGLMLSNISYVWMPYSIQFSGPYYLHGIPYYRNGTMVTTQYSGGCVRLPHGVDQIVYDWADVGTTVVITGA